MLRLVLSRPLWRRHSRCTPIIITASSAAGRFLLSITRDYVETSGIASFCNLHELLMVAPERLLS
jgi:hypothetical protein